MDNIFLDIETIPSQEPWVREYVSETVKPPAQMKKAETIQKWIEEEKENAVEAALDKTVFEGATNHIVAISIARNDMPVCSWFISDVKDEAQMLEKFYFSIGALGQYGRRFVGHNIINFDLRVIKQRSMVLGVKPCAGMPFNEKPWSEVIFDTMIRWDAKNYVKMDLLARAFGFDGKGEMDGSKVYEAWKAGEFQKISDYCADDVELTRKIYNRMKGF